MSPPQPEPRQESWLGTRVLLLALPHNQKHRIHRQSPHPTAEATRLCYCPITEPTVPWQNRSPIGETNRPCCCPIAESDVPYLPHCRTLTMKLLTHSQHCSPTGQPTVPDQTLHPAAGATKPFCSHCPTAETTGPPTAANPLAHGTAPGKGTCPTHSVHGGSCVQPVVCCAACCMLCDTLCCLLRVMCHIVPPVACCNALRCKLHVTLHISRAPCCPGPRRRSSHGTLRHTAVRCTVTPRPVPSGASRVARCACTVSRVLAEPCALQPSVVQPCPALPRGVPRHAMQSSPLTACRRSGKLL